MARRYIRLILPNMEKIQQRKGFSKIGYWMEKHPSLFSLQRKKVALGFAIGIAIGVIPLPIQVFFSIFMCYFLNASIPATILAALIMNPLTYPIVLAFTLHLGSLFSSMNISDIVFPSNALLFSHPIDWLEQINLLLKNVGELLLFGIPVCSLILGLISYWFVRFSWFIIVVWQWRRRPWRHK